MMRALGNATRIRPIHKKLFGDLSVTRAARGPTRRRIASYSSAIWAMRLAVNRLCQTRVKCVGLAVPEVQLAARGNVAMVRNDLLDQHAWFLNEACQG